MARVSTAAKALGRSCRAERTLTFLAGAAGLLGGVAVLLVGYGVFGEFRGRRPVLDPIAVDWLGTRAMPAKIVAIVLGVLLVVLGLRWFFRSLRPEGRPDLVLQESELTVTATAIANAVRADAEGVAGVSKAQVRSVGDAANPALRLTVSLCEGADLKKVWRELDTRVLARARESLGVEKLPTAVRIELDAAARQRVR
jgi:hypothetical protein